MKNTYPMNSVPPPSIGIVIVIGFMFWDPYLFGSSQVFQDAPSIYSLLKGPSDAVLVLSSVVYLYDGFMSLLV